MSKIQCLACCTLVQDEKGSVGLTRSLSQTLPGEEMGDGDAGKAHETPFELRALEVALDVVRGRVILTYENNTRTLLQHL